MNRTDEHWLTLTKRHESHSPVGYMRLRPVSPGSHVFEVAEVRPATGRLGGGVKDVNRSDMRETQCMLDPDPADTPDLVLLKSLFKVAQGLLKDTDVSFARRAKPRRFLKFFKRSANSVS